MISHVLRLGSQASRRLLRRLGFETSHYRGIFPTRVAAERAICPGLFARRKEEEAINFLFERMCKIHLWDWPVLYYLKPLLNQTQVLLDAGGHLGTKYRAFRNQIPFRENLRWIVYDLPAIVRAGRERAESDGLNQLEFIDNLKDAPATDVFLGSGLLQYLDIPFGDLLRQLPILPRHVILNKVATHDKPTVFTLENFGRAEVPYQIRNHAEFLAELSELGYEVVDHWQISELSHTIKSRGKKYVSTSNGFYARLRN